MKDKIFCYASLALLVLVVASAVGAAYDPNWPPPDLELSHETIHQEKETFSKARIILSRNPEDQSARDYILRQ